VAAALESRFYTSQPKLNPPTAPSFVQSLVPSQLALGQGTWHATGGAHTSGHSKKQKKKKKKKKQKKQQRAGAGPRRRATRGSRLPASATTRDPRASRGRSSAVSSRQTLRSTLPPPRSGRRPASESAATLREGGYVRDASTRRPVSPLASPGSAPDVVPASSPWRQQQQRQGGDWSDADTESLASLPDPPQPVLPLAASPGGPSARGRHGHTTMGAAASTSAAGGRSLSNVGAAATMPSLRSRELMASVSMPSLARSSRLSLSRAQRQRQTLVQSGRSATSRGGTMPPGLASTAGAGGRRRQGKGKGKKVLESTNQRVLAAALLRSNRGVTVASQYVPKPRPADWLADSALRQSGAMTRDRLKAERAVPKRSHAVWDVVANHPRLRPPRRSETAAPDSVGNKHREAWNGNVMLMKRMSGAPSDAQRYSYLVGRRCL